jgi:hypothetical protein
VKTIPDELYYTYIVASSGKLSLLDGLLKRLLKDGHKVSYALRRNANDFMICAARHLE